MIFQYPPVHTRLRGMVNQAFMPRKIKDMEPRILEIAKQQIDRVQARGSMEFITEFAIPVAVIIIAEILGVPGHVLLQPLPDSFSGTYVASPPDSGHAIVRAGHDSCHVLSCHSHLSLHGLPFLPCWWSGMFCPHTSVKSRRLEAEYRLLCCCHLANKPIISRKSR